MSLSLHVNTSCLTLTLTQVGIGICLDLRLTLWISPYQALDQCEWAKKGANSLPPPPRGFGATLFDPLFPLSWSLFQANMRKALPNLQEFFLVANIKTNLSAQPLIWKWFFIVMQIKLFSTRKVVHLASFWNWRFLEIGSGLFFGGKTSRQFKFYHSRNFEESS